jgi:hypothetical protein
MPQAEAVARRCRWKVIARERRAEMRRRVLLGLAVLACGLVAVPRARAGDAVPLAPQPQTMGELVRMSQAELTALYLAAPPAPLPSGFLPGRAIKDPGSARTARNARTTRLVWQGKIFRDDGTMINRFFGVTKAIPGQVYVGESVLDGRPSLILDYSKSRLWPTVRDEVREVAPGLYLGIMYKGGAMTDPPMFFTLDARR